MEARKTLRTGSLWVNWTNTYLAGDEKYGQVSVGEEPVPVHLGLELHR